MKQKSFLFLLALLMLCAGCSRAAPAASQTPGSVTSTYIDDDGALVFEFGEESPSPEPADKGEVVTREGAEKEISEPEGSIGWDKAVELADKSDPAALYLPCPVSELKKYCAGLTVLGEKDYYSMSFYVEKDSVRLFVGTKVLAACDGSQVLKQDWSGSFVEVPQTGAKALTQREDLKISPEEALMAVYQYDLKKLGLTERLSAYTFEFSDQVYKEGDLACYKITPKLHYEKMIQLSSPVYVSVSDGTLYQKQAGEETLTKLS